MDRRCRIVLDTNVLISDAIKPQGQQAQVVYLVAMGAVELFASAEILAEYREVFGRKTFPHLPAGSSNPFDFVFSSGEAWP